MYSIMILLLIAIAGVFLATMIPIPGHISIKIVKSGSMEPAIHVGAIVVIKPQDSYAVGDVITFGPDTKTQIPTTHRILEVGSDNGMTIFTTQGDANEDPDPTHVKIKDVHGKVLFTVPYAGYVLDFAKKPLGFGLMIGLPAGIIILDEVMRIIGEVKNLRGNASTAVRRRREDEDMDSRVVTMHDLRRIERSQGDTGTPTLRRNIDGISPQQIL